MNLAISKLVSTALSDDLATRPSFTASAESTSLPVNNRSAATWKIDKWLWLISDGYMIMI